MTTCSTRSRMPRSCARSASTAAKARTPTGKSRRSCNKRASGKLPFPAPHASDVDVDEIVVGIGIIADPAYPQAKRGVVKVAQLPAGKRDVGGLPLHVETVRRHARVELVQRRIRFRRTVTRRQLEPAIGVELAPDLVHQIEQL